MKSKIEKIKIAIVFFILGLVLSSGLVYAVTLYQAKEVAYDNSNSGTDKTEVQSAIDELYQMAETHCPDGYICTKPSFAEDSWATIATNVKNGNASFYKVGDTKEVEVAGYGTFTVRVANNSTPSECSTEGFSQTACGFIVEFADIITNGVMNSAYTNVGGWRDSAMRTFVNDTIYNALPEDLRNVVSDTYVVSGHGSSDTNNFTTMDKLYLLSTKEVWGKNETSNTVNYDTAEAETRQLDYYSNLGVSTSNYSGAKKYNSSGSASYWLLRSATSNSSNRFYTVNWNGAWIIHFAPEFTYGVAPAFRIS